MSNSLLVNAVVFHAIQRLATMAAVLAFGVSLASAEDVADNLVKNPSFEQHSRKESTPNDWNGDPQVYQSDVSVHHGGSASLRYQNSDSKRYLLCTQRLAVKPGWLIRFSAWIKTQNIAGDGSGATLAVEWSDRSGKWLGGAYCEGIKDTRDWTLLENVCRVPQNARSATISCYVAKHMAGTAWFDDVSATRVKSSSLNTVLLSPNYRGHITAEGPKEVRAFVKLNPVDYDATPNEIRLAITLRDRSKRELCGLKDILLSQPSTSAPSTSDAVITNLTLPIGNLLPGVYDLEVQASRPNGDILATSHHRLERVADDFKPHCSIDSHRRLLVDGRPFFPIGMYCSSIDAEIVKAFADSKFNCMMAYGSPNKAQMDLAWKTPFASVVFRKGLLCGPSGQPRPYRSRGGTVGSFALQNVP